MKKTLIFTFLTLFSGTLSSIEPVVKKEIDWKKTTRNIAYVAASGISTAVFMHNIARLRNSWPYLKVICTTKELSLSDKTMYCFEKLGGSTVYKMFVPLTFSIYFGFKVIKELKNGFIVYKNK
jgi:hypothetical protein